LASKKGGDSGNEIIDARYKIANAENMKNMDLASGSKKAKTAARTAPEESNKKI
jgi:hypothetical protein